MRCPARIDYNAGADLLGDARSREAPEPSHGEPDSGIGMSRLIQSPNDPGNSFRQHEVPEE